MAGLLVVLGCQPGRRAPADGAVPGAGAAAGAPPTTVAPTGAGGPASGVPVAPSAPRLRDPSLLWENDLADLEGDVGCATREVVSGAEGQDPRLPLWRAYEAARRAVVEGVDAPHAEVFADQFTRTQNRPWILEQYWPRVKAHLPKYLLTSRETTFVICRVEERDGRWKGFVKSFSRDKSNPPITVEMEDGVPRISFFTY